jgi:hypothetical protein
VVIWVGVTWPDRIWAAPVGRGRAGEARPEWIWLGDKEDTDQRGRIEAGSRRRTADPAGEEVGGGGDCNSVRPDLSGQRRGRISVADGDCRSKEDDQADCIRKPYWGVV